MKKNLLFIFLLLIAMALMTIEFFKQSKAANEEQELVLQLEENALIHCDFERIDSFHFVITNDQEKIHITDISYKNDSVVFFMPVFNTKFSAKIEDGQFYGYWWNTLKSDSYRVRFWTQSKDELDEIPEINYTGNYECYFLEENNNSSPAIATFSQKGNKITGTFRTETGDYRYLSGYLDGTEMHLSTFDGSHAFYFNADTNYNILRGTFRSGTHYKQEWIAVKNDDFKLSDMKQLTHLKEGYSSLEFKMKGLDGEFHQLSDSIYRNKVLIIQILGTWCPNCMDETRYLVELHNKYHAEGLEIIGLDFEPDTSFQYFKKRATRFVKDLAVPYTILQAGPSNKEEAQKRLPMLNKLISYPTAIFIDREGKIQEIHTGFNGPGTGEHYLDYTKETELLIKTLLK